MKVFVLNSDGSPLMPCSPRTARIKLKKEEAIVVNGIYFTIKMVKKIPSYTQDINIGIDCGMKNVGVSIISGKTEIKSMEVQLRTNVSILITEKRNYRKTRRGNKLRYRKQRINRESSFRKGKLQPSVEHKLNEHIRIIDGLKKLLPGSKLVLETALFDIQKIDNPNIYGTNYQKGLQYGFTNVKQYILFRDKYTCQCGINSKTKCSKYLEVHHIVFKSKGGSDKPSNLITLCSKHHKELHNNKWTFDFDSLNKTRKNETIMSIIRLRLLLYYTDAIETFGYITKVNRQNYMLPKTHYNDAFIIAGGNNIINRSNIEFLKFKRKNNRSIQLNRSGFKPSIRKKRYTIQPGDVILFENNKHIAAGTQNKGLYVKILGDNKPKSIKNIKLLYNVKTLYKIEGDADAGESI